MGLKVLVRGMCWWHSCTEVQQVYAERRFPMNVMCLYSDSQSNDAAACRSIKDIDHGVADC